MPRGVKICRTVVLASLLSALAPLGAAPLYGAMPWDGMGMEQWWFDSPWSWGGMPGFWSRDSFGGWGNKGRHWDPGLREWRDGGYWDRYSPSYGGRSRYDDRYPDWADNRDYRSDRDYYPDNRGEDYGNRRNSRDYRSYETPAPSYEKPPLHSGGSGYGGNYQGTDNPWGGNRWGNESDRSRSAPQAPDVGGWNAPSERPWGQPPADRAGGSWGR